MESIYDILENLHKAETGYPRDKLFSNLTEGRVKEYVTKISEILYNQDPELFSEYGDEFVMDTIKEFATKTNYASKERVAQMVKDWLGSDEMHEARATGEFSFRDETGPEDEEDWYDADGTPNPHGAFDAGGHYYGERDADAIDAAYDDYRDSQFDDYDFSESAANVYSDAQGHHLKNADNEVIQSYEKNPEGLKQARNDLYKNYNTLSVEKPEDDQAMQMQEAPMDAGPLQGSKMKGGFSVQTGGDGLWSDEQREVPIVKLEIGYHDNEEDGYGELRAYFHPRAWNVNKNGLIYTDKGFLRQFRKALIQMGLNGNDIDYSEQGMQGDNYVSFDVGSKFLDSWAKKMGQNSARESQEFEAYEAQFESALKESLTESMSITTSAGTDQQDTVNVTATDEDAHTLISILKAAGLPYKEREAQLMPTASPCAMGAELGEEEYSNEPNDDVLSGDMNHMNTQSGGLNREKRMYKKEYPGDNPMAVREDEEKLLRNMWNLYKTVK